MKKLLLIFLFAALPCRAAEVYTELSLEAAPIWLGSPSQFYRTSPAVTKAVPMSAGDVALVSAEGEGSIYVYPWGNGIYTFPMFITTAVLVFAPGYTPPSLHDLSTPFPGGTYLANGMGMDVAHSSPNYYYPASRSGAFKAPVAGTYTFALYFWGGSTAAGTGNATSVYPGTARITVTVIH